MGTNAEFGNSVKVIQHGMVVDSCFLPSVQRCYTPETELSVSGHVLLDDQAGWQLSWHNQTMTNQAPETQPIARSKSGLSEMHFVVPWLFLEEKKQLS